MIYLGVDGGGTGTSLRLVRADGTVAARADVPSTYYFGRGVDHVTDVLRTGIDLVCARAGIEQREIGFAFFGLPGYGERSADRAALDAAPAALLHHTRYTCGNDMICGWAGSLAGHDGINVVSGTGSLAYGRHGDLEARCGGWGELFSDEGSAYWIATRGLAAFSRMSDGREAPGPLATLLRRHLGLAADLDVIGLVLEEWAGRRDLVAALAPVVTAAAAAGDATATAVLARAGEELARMALTVHRRLGRRDPGEVVPVSWSGGVFTAAPVREAFLDALASAGTDQLEPVRPRFGPDLGAALWAARLAGRPLPDDALARLASEPSSTPRKQVS